MLNEILWQAEKPVTLTVQGEGQAEFEVTARPVIFSYYFGVTPGLLMIEDGRIGWWYSGNVTDVINAWRAVSLIPRLKRIRERPSGYDQTLCCLVISLRGDNHEERRKRLGTDFGLSPEATTELIEQTKLTGPSPEELEVILEKLGEKLYVPPGYDNHLVSVEKAEDAGCVTFTDRAMELVFTARISRHSYEHQMDADEVELQEPVEPLNSFAQLATDLAMTNFMDHDVDWGWSEVKLEELDERIKHNSIGRFAYEDGLRLNVSEKAYNDPSAHYSTTTTDGAITFYSSNFGQISPPFVEVGDKRLIFHRVRYHRGGMFWVFTTIQPLSVQTKADDTSQAIWIQVPEIRWTIGTLLGLESVELPVGLSLAPMVESAPAAIKAKRRFGRG